MGTAKALPDSADGVAELTIMTPSTYTARMIAPRTPSSVSCAVSLPSPAHTNVRADFKIYLAATRVRYADALS